MQVELQIKRRFINMQSTCIVETIRNRLGVFERVQQSMIRHVHVYIEAGGGHFGAFVVNCE